MGNRNQTAEGSRTGNAKRNIIFGIILKAYQLLIPFLMRTAMIYIMGVQYLGLNSLFTSIIQVLNLAELGVGAAMVYSMYKPAAEQNQDKMCALLNLYKIYYRVIGGIIAVVGICVTPFVSRLISGNIPPEINIYIIYLLNLFSAVLSYWLFAYKNSLLQAHQRADVSSKVTLITSTIQYAIQFLVLWLYHDYYFYLITALFTQALNNIITAIAATKMYPQYQPVGKISKKEKKEINQKVRDLFTSKLGFGIVNFADSIVISAFLGLTVLAEYQNYYYIINAITGFVFVINGSITAGIGNSMITESLEKNYHDFEKYNFILFWIMGFCVTCFISLMQPFMKIWVGENLMLPFTIVWLLSVYFIVNVLERSISNFKDACGLWHEDRLRPMIYGFSNLVLNLILVKLIGLSGVILSTVVTCVIISIPWLIFITFNQIYKRSPKKYLISIMKYSVVIVFVAFSTWLICSNININIYADFIIKLVICIIIPNAAFGITYRHNPLLKECLKLIKR